MASLLTRTEIARILGIDDETDIPPAVVTWAEDEVQKVLGKNYSAVTAQEKIFFLTNNRQNYLEMPFFDNMSVSKIEYHVEDVDDVVEEVDEWITITATDYYLEVDTAMIFFDYELSRRVKYKVTYAYGGSTPTYLEKKLHLLMTLNYLQKFNSDLLSTAGDVKKETIGEYSIEYAINATTSSVNNVETEISSLVDLLGGSRGQNDVGMV